MKKLFPLLVLVAALTACKSEEEKSQEYYESGAAYLEKGEYSSAELEFKNALKINPHNIDAQFGTAVIYENKKRWVELEKTLVGILDFDPEYIDARIKLTNLYLGQNKIDKAMVHTEKLMTQQLQNPMVKTLRAAVLYKIDDRDGARALIDQVLAAHPHYVDAVILKAHDLLFQDKNSDAIAVLDGALKEQPRSVVLNIVLLQALNKAGEVSRAESVYRTLIDIYPDNSNIPLSLARHLASNNQVKEAVALLETQAEQKQDTEFLFKAIELVNDRDGIDAAETLTKKYLQQFPALERLRFALVDIYVKTGRLDEGVAELDKIWLAGGETRLTVDAGLRKGRLELMNNSLPEAEKTIGRLEELDASNPKVAVLQGDLLLAKNDGSGAIRVLRTALRQVAVDADVFAALAKAHRAQAEFELANEYFAKAVRAPDGIKYAVDYAQFLLEQKKLSLAEQILQQLILRNRGSERVLNLLAQVKLAKEQWQEAEMIADQMQQIEGEDTVVAYIRGMAASGKGDSEGAIAAMENLQKLSPDSMRSMVLLVDAYIKAGQRDQAENFLNRVIATDPNSYTGYFLRGNLHLYFGEAGPAVRDYQQAIKNDPEKEGAYNALAKLNLRLGKVADAERVLSQGVRQLPESETLTAFRAELHRRAGELDQAVAMYRALLARNDSLDVVANNLASTLITLGGADNLQSALQVAARFRTSKVPQFLDTLGWAYVLNNQLDDGLSLLRRASLKLPDEPEIAYHLAEGYFRNQDYTNAKIQVDEALAKGIDSASWYTTAKALQEKIAAAL